MKTFHDLKQGRGNEPASLFGGAAEARTQAAELTLKKLEPDITREHLVNFVFGKLYG